MTAAPEPRCIAMAGCGVMGGVLLSGWVAAFPNCRFLVLEPRDLAVSRANVEHFRAPGPFCELLADAQALVLAVKPQSLAALADALNLPAGLPLISIAAGVGADEIRTLLPAAGPVTRAMPNLPAAVGRGVTSLAGDRSALADALFGAVGRGVWLEREDLMHAATAVAGSGPAYVFYLVEALARAGETAGLDAQAAEALARATVEGGGALLVDRTGEPPAALRAAVTSRGGTTAAGLGVLMDGRLDALLAKTVAAAAARSRDLGKYSHS